MCCQCRKCHRVIELVALELDTERIALAMCWMDTRHTAVQSRKQMHDLTDLMRRTVISRFDEPHPGDVGTGTPRKLPRAEITDDVDEYVCDCGFRR